MMVRVSHPGADGMVHPVQLDVCLGSEEAEADQFVLGVLDFEHQEFRCDGERFELKCGVS